MSKRPTQMSDTHLENTIRLMRRKAKEGIEVVVGCEESVDVDVFYSQDALDHMDYSIYVDERRRRKRLGKWSLDDKKWRATLGLR